MKPWQYIAWGMQVRAEANLSIHAFAVFIVLLRYAQGKDICHPSVPRLCNDIGVRSEATVRKAVQELVEAEIVSVGVRKGPQDSNLYRILHTPSRDEVPHGMTLPHQMPAKKNSLRTSSRDKKKIIRRAPSRDEVPHGMREGHEITLGTNQKRKYRVVRKKSKNKPASSSEQKVKTKQGYNNHKDPDRTLIKERDLMDSQIRSVLEESDGPVPLEEIVKLTGFSRYDVEPALEFRIKPRHTKEGWSLR